MKCMHIGYVSAQEWRKEEEKTCLHSSSVNLYISAFNSYEIKYSKMAMKLAICLKEGAGDRQFLWSAPKLEDCGRLRFTDRI